MARMLFLRDIDADVQLRCRACGHGGVLPRAMLERRFGPNYPVLSIAPHYRCSRCDSRDIESRPILAPPAASFEAANEEPSFDAPLAALNGLLASLRGDGPVEGAQASSPPPPPSSFAPVRSKPLSELPLSDLVADGPGDDGAAPLWEPVSLADMAARLGAIRPDEDDPGREGDPDGGEPVDGGWDDPPPPARPAGKETARDSVPDADPDEGADETLAAMHRLLAQAHWSEDDEPEDRPPVAARHFEPQESGADYDGRAEEDEPPVFSHKVLVRKDFEEDWADPDSDRWRVEKDDSDEVDGFDDEEEPSDEEILSFAIRDPEKPAARLSERSAIKPAKPATPPADEPLDFDQHRAERRAQRPPPPPEDEEGFDRTLAALRSMIEDAANDPEDDAPPPPRKSPAAGEGAIGKGPDRNTGGNSSRTTGWQDDDKSGDDPLSGVDADPAPDPEPDIDRDPAPAGRRSAQEREIEEAMTALRGLIEEEVASEPPPSAPLPKPRAGKPRPPPRREPPARSPEEVEPTEPAAKQGSKATDPTPLSKTIAALRGMLELDGKRKR